MQHWKLLPDYIPTVSRLVNGWYVFLFIEGKDASQILDSLCPICNGLLVLIRWHT